MYRTPSRLDGSQLDTRQKSDYSVTLRNEYQPWKRYCLNVGMSTSSHIHR